MQNQEHPYKIISLGETLLAVLILIYNHSLIRLYKKTKEHKYKDNEKNNSKEQIEDMEHNNDYLDKKDIEKDKEFFPFIKKNNINDDEKYLCSIYEIKRINNDINSDQLYEFITTSNSTYTYGENKLEFCIVENNNESIEYKKIKKISDIACS